MFVAHISENNDIQTVKTHCGDTAKLAQSFSIKELKDLVYNIAMLHDIGKYQPSFQKRINGNNAIKAPHALCGAKESELLYGENALSLMLQYCIAGHHSGIPNSGTRADRKDAENVISLYATLGRECENYDVYKDELHILDLDKKTIEEFLIEGCTNDQDIAEKYAFIIRYCFSCLTDADSLDTEAFCTGKTRGKKESNFLECLKILEKTFNSFTITTELQKARGSLQSQVYEKIDSTGQIFLMNMPTGSGKTLCSLKFALERAEKHNKKRIVYIIPYNSIIDQTANEFQKLFNDNLNILRHQSSFSYELQEDIAEDYKQWANKSIENWDADFIITTAVQFFESIYGNKRGKLRKLHNMADTILIFDEAHLMPVEYLEPCLKGIIHITKFLHSEAVFLTATMPNFKNIIENHIKNEVSITNLITDTSLFAHFQRCSYKYIEFETYDDVILHSNSIPSTLIIANTKKTARKLYSQCVGEKYHLSTYMIGEDRKKTIEVIKERIKLLLSEFNTAEDIPDERKITVVSTSLIEAGVDLDFHQVYREIAGLDNILQSGGRCNREGLRKNATTIVFDVKENIGVERVEQSLTRGLLKEYEDINNPKCIEDYYARLFELKAEEIVKHTLYEKGQKPYLIPFKDYAEKFNLIADSNISIIVPMDEYCEAIMEKARITQRVNVRDVQSYTVSISQKEFAELFQQGVIDDFKTGAFFLTNTQDYYNAELGITFESKDYFI